MANFDFIWPFVKKAEGGLTDNPKDSASNHPVPGTFTINGKTSKTWHTNKGVTWLTFKEFAYMVGLKPEPDDFFNLSDDKVKLIAKKKYWDKWHLDEYDHQGLADIVFTWFWGSGYSAFYNASVSNSTLFRIMKSKGYNCDGPITLKNAMNSIVLKDKLFNDLCFERAKFFRDISDYNSDNKVFLTGWLLRLEKFKQWHGMGNGTPLKVIAVVGVLFLAWKYFS